MAPHVPVLLKEVLEHLKPADGQRFIDATFGAGGYTRAILAAAECSVWAIDRDPSAIHHGKALVEAAGGRLELSQMAFGDLLSRVLETPALAGGFDGMVLDLGVSSMQLDDARRGFSFQRDGPLDMRMSEAIDGQVIEARPSASDIVNTADEDVLADIFYQLGDERRSRRIAAAIVAQRQRRPITRTGELADLIVSVVGRRGHEKIHPATRVFQALRIYVNDELGELARGLSAGERLLRAGGRLVVVTFHSAEDRMVKRFFAQRSGRVSRGSRHLPQIESVPAPSFQIINQRAVSPGNEEVRENPRARSAKLRFAMRSTAEAWPHDPAALGVPPVLLDLR